MDEKERLELMELDYSRRMEYLSRYYEVSSAFYNVEDTVVSDLEIDCCIANLKEKPTSVIRRQIKLKDWKFSSCPQPDARQNGFYSADYDESEWRTVSIPHASMHVPENPIRYGNTDMPMLISEPGQNCTIWRGDYSFWYKSRAWLGPVAQDDTVSLSFESVNLKSDVWVNGNVAMLDHLGLFPFKMDITDSVRKAKDGSTVIALKVTNTASTLPVVFYNGMQYAYSGKPFSEGRTELDWNDQVWAGIAGDAVITVTHSTYIENAFLFTTEIRDGNASMRCLLSIRNASWKSFHGSASVTVSKWLPNEEITSAGASCEVSALPMNDSCINLTFDIENADLWSVENPNLYLAHIFLKDADGRPVDDLYETFGARSFRMQGSNFFLNNKRTILRGTHDVCHYAGEPTICPSDRSIVRDLLYHKKMGANCSRWPSDIRMHYKRIADYCDQFGFMLSWAGYFEMWLIHPEAEMYATRDVKAMVRALRNCPSIVIWEMGDEVLLGMQHYRRFRWFDAMYEMVLAEDSSRPIIPSGDYANDLAHLINVSSCEGADMEKRRNNVLSDYPLYQKELAAWDYHYCPCLLPIKPFRPVIDMVREALGGQKATIFTEFGCDGLPRPETIHDVYGGFRWAESPFIASSREKVDLGCYGRKVTPELWRETQAFQAAVVGGMIGYLRQYPHMFAGFYFISMFDVWTFYWGAADASGRCKLLYFVAKNYYGLVYVSGLHGDVILRTGSPLYVTVSNYGDALFGATLQVIIKDKADAVVWECAYEDLAIGGDAAVSGIAKVEIPPLPNGLYTIEYRLTVDGGKCVCSNIELFFMET